MTGQWRTTRIVCRPRCTNGTSTLFLEGIIEAGLGGRNQLAEWKVLEFATVVYPLVREHLSTDPDWMVKAQSFGFMVEQRSGQMNFQHGDAYLSPSAAAVRYAVNKRYGSELLSYTLDFLQEMLRRKIPSVADDLYHEYPQMFNLLDVSSAPLLIGVDGAAVDELVAEKGGDAAPVFNHVLATLRENRDGAEILLQQSNFRLRRAIPVSRLTFWLVNVTHWNPVFPQYLAPHAVRPWQPWRVVQRPTFPNPSDALHGTKD